MSVKVKNYSLTASLDNNKRVLLEERILSTALELVLIIVGLFLTIVWFSVIALPLIYGFPRALYWSLRRWAKWRTPFLYLISPLIWTVVFVSVAFILVFVFPNVATYLRQSGGFALGQTLGIILSVGRAIFSRSTHVDMSLDFYNFIRPHLTLAGGSHVGVASDPKE